VGAADRLSGADGGVRDQPLLAGQSRSPIGDDRPAGAGLRSRAGAAGSAGAGQQRSRQRPAGIPIDGIAVRDRPEDLAAFLGGYGDPFRAIGADDDRRVQLALGSAGVPETFVIDGNGIIRHQHIGAIMESDIPAIVAAYEAAR
jgi:hypothetical protein